MLAVEHIGIAVKNLSASLSLFEKLLNASCYKQEFVESENVNTAFLRSGETKIELLEGADEHNAITAFLNKKGEGIHHIAFEVENIKIEMQRLQQQGFVLLSSEPKKGADNKLVCFLHPKNTNGVLIELCQEIAPQNAL